MMIRQIKPRWIDMGGGGGRGGTGMKTCYGIKVDEPCTREGFLENWQIQHLVTHVFQWMVTFLYGIQHFYVLLVQDEEEWG
jgi:hypothetical protein